MEWFDAPDPKEYGPAVAAFRHLREVLANAEDIAKQNRVLEKSPECLRTLQRLQRDVDEIVGHINDKMRIGQNRGPVQPLSVLLHRLIETVRDTWLEQTPGYKVC